ncbi:hypothetical protein [Candidatus Bodocaedibacter vickermanii]|uniref:Uncharacterized protein n=1 Tax=Candidatus Bodocaedibacter vickermanii TaxID=2741701 RepID=A0A7L9RT95_9PROT|nr:hypothetical protein CPBP_00519 [Candidatus Paracaedibacteraceae bacterium 'Lake Konstanz']
MKKIYIYMIVCMVIGVLMAFKHSIKTLFIENLNTPTSVDLAWVVPDAKIYEARTLLELQYFSPKLAGDTIVSKLTELKAKGLGIHTVLLSGSIKIGTNTYIRELAKTDWGIEEIRVHSTAAINLYAFLNLIKSAHSLKRVLIWNNGWDNESLDKIRKVMLDPKGLVIK